MAVTEAPSRLAWLLVALFVAALAVIVAVVVIRDGEPVGDVGQLQEAVIERSPAIPLPVLVDSTQAWGLAGATMWNSDDQMAGGATAVDLDGDGGLELVVANGDVAIRSWNGASFDPATMLGIESAVGVSAVDLDRDGWSDLLVARSDDDDLVVWGGPSVGRERLVLASTGASSGLLAADLNGDGQPDIVRMGRNDGDEAAPDVLWVGRGPREFQPQELPSPDRFTLAGTLVDADDDGLLDIWLTRDVGWIHGPDSVLSRQGEPAGAWADVAPELGVAKAIDGMGITIADLDADGDLDAYVSDLGDNEQLIDVGSGFAAAVDTGAARIRPLGASDDVVSSSWGSGPIDVNLDGLLDLVVVGGGFPIGQVRNKIEGTEVAVTEPPSVLLGQGDGTYVDVWSELGLDVDLAARGMTIADFDGDGDDDVVVVGRLGELVALENQTVGSSVAVVVGPTCAGLGLTVNAPGYGVPIERFSYAGQHGPSVIVGTPAVRAVEESDAAVNVRVESLDGRNWTAMVDVDDRVEFEVIC